MILCFEDNHKYLSDPDMMYGLDYCRYIENGPGGNEPEYYELMAIMREPDHLLNFSSEIMAPYFMDKGDIREVIKSYCKTETLNNVIYWYNPNCCIMTYKQWTEYCEYGLEFLQEEYQIVYTTPITEVNVSWQALEKCEDYWDYNGRSLGDALARDIDKLIKEGSV